MNDELRKAINVRNMLKRKFNKYKTEHNWMRYKSHQTHVNYLRRKSLETFINLKCSQPNKCNGNDFWHTVRPLISDKSTKNSDQIILSE